MTTSNQRILDVFGTLTQEIVADLDVIDFLSGLTQHCVEILGAAATGFLVVDHRGTLNVMAASTDHAEILDVLYLQAEEGPLLDSVTTGDAVLCEDLTDAAERWPRFVSAATNAGFDATFATPMRLRNDILGGLSVLHTRSVALSPDLVVLAQTLTDIATIALVNERTTRRDELVVEQIQAALNDRILVEQAKGVLAEHLNTTVDKAFRALRHGAQRNGQRLADFARAVVDGTADTAQISRQADSTPETTG